MLAPFQQMISSFSWSSEDPIIHQQNNISIKPETSGSALGVPSSQQEVGNCSELTHPDSKNDGKVVKKQYHNAIERDLRKRVNGLYDSLRSLLPEADQAEKLSIPRTVASVVKYIPELEKEVEKLVQKKEALTIKMCRLEGYAYFGNQRLAEFQSKLLFVSASQSGDREIGVQISILKSIHGSFSESLQYLEHEGFLLLNMSCFESLKGTVFYNLHLQVHVTQAMDVERLREKLLSIYENRDLRC